MRSRRAGRTVMRSRRAGRTVKIGRKEGRGAKEQQEKSRAEEPKNSRRRAGPVYHGGYPAPRTVGYIPLPVPYPRYTLPVQHRPARAS